MIRCPHCRSTEVAVSVRHGNHSAFNGYRFVPSAYSELRCRECMCRWRSRAPSVDALPDANLCVHGRPMGGGGVCPDCNARWSS